MTREKIVLQGLDLVQFPDSKTAGIQEAIDGEGTAFVLPENYVIRKQNTPAKRWKRLRAGKFGRMSILRRVPMVGMTAWRVFYFYQDGDMQTRLFSTFNDARASQLRFLNGWKK